MTEKKYSSGLVYSTETGKMCPACVKPITQCQCRKKSTPSSSDGIIRVSRETKGRKGKGVTIITGIKANPEHLSKLAKQFKQKCASGGTLKNGVIEIQGDHRTVLIEELKKLGFTVKD
ncbi:MAG: translation initiation factor Sui1 [Chlamydiota bacterium]|nr:translation initiation factor Sui1 [Chlamydiota bacterium]